MRQQCLSLLPRPPPQYRDADDNVAAHLRVALRCGCPRIVIAEGEDVGRVIEAAESAVEPAAFGGADETNGQRRVALLCTERAEQPATQRRTHREGRRTGCLLNRQPKRWMLPAMRPLVACSRAART